MDQAIVDALNELLVAERAGVETLSLLKRQNPALEPDMARIESDEVWSCAGLDRSIRALEGVASRVKGDFSAKVQSQPSLKNKLQLLAQGQGWVVKRVDSLLEMALPPDVTSFLSDMKVVHQRNIEWCHDQVKAMSRNQ